MANKKPKEAEAESSEQNGVHELLQAIAQNQQEFSDRLSDLEESAQKVDTSATIVKLANMYFNTDDKHITELSFISPLAARPFAEAMALDAMTTDEIRRGDISLNKLLILNYLRLQRSVRGRLLGIGAEAMREQVSSEANKEEEMPDYEAGKE